ncbi:MULTISPECIES: GTP pyrophosphokinase family protein [Peptoniphilus]|uniref:GTP pyrophosphokinase n=1 Tax=Peptoniphilus TaxID=162289 RepID=UPI0001DCA149|nr:RelA/SpoT domain-containing protein [Peptoniphilus sp. oral taxon 836]EFK39305.1 RelA/SpoT domain protein [Peptoniphilus sp. oral taxon 836 str. F0141]
MKLELFKYIDDVLDLFEYHRQELVSINKEVRNYFSDVLKDDERALNLSTRIKTPQSLREKLIRRNYYIKYPTPFEGFKKVPDLIGLRIECRFIKDEKEIYQKIIDEFRIYCGKGYYASNINKNIRLNLEDIQPQVLNNGFKIYKLDGLYKNSKTSYSFELQIKSLVNLFWGEIDHKILYKNYNYMIVEDFFRDIMHSIIDNLFMVDKQLMILYDHVTNSDASGKDPAEKQLKVLLSKIIHDVFINKIYGELGFVFNIKVSTDIIVEFIFMKLKKNKDNSYGEDFISLINRINEISTLDMNLEEYINVDEKPKFYDSFTRNIGNLILASLNKDFEWNIFFKIITTIDKESDNQIFEDFIHFVRYQYTLLILKLFENFDLSEDDKRDIENFILNLVIDKFKNNTTLEFLMVKSINKINFILESLKFSEIEGKEDLKELFKKEYKF